MPAGPYATRARLAALECRTAALSPKTTAAERAALVKDLRTFVEATPAKGADEPRVALAPRSWVRWWRWAQRRPIATRSSRC